jgi:hypothetical protein
MTKYDIAQKLALLPEGMPERNLQSWKEMVEYFGRIPVSEGEYSPQLFGIHEILDVFLVSEQAKLFKAGKSLYDLIISTADGQEPKNGEPFLRIYYAGGLMARYEINSSIKDKNLITHERKSCNLEDDVMTNLQPMLDLLWSETRGKKNT